MRRLVVWGGIFLVLWCFWWGITSMLMRQGAAAWLQERRADGWLADADIAQTGFPLRLRTAVTGLTLTDPITGDGLTADKLELTAPTYWPGFLTLDLPDTPIVLRLSGQEFRLRPTDATVDLRLHPVPSLQLQNLTAHSGAWLLSTPLGAVLSADDLDFAVTQDAEKGNTYAFSITSNAVTPGDVLRRSLALPESWPHAFDNFSARMTAGFDTAWDRHALIGPPPQPRHIEVQELNVAWGALRLSGDGTLVINDAGIPTGNLSLRLTNWQQTLDVATNAGLLNATMGNQAQLLLGGLANIGGGGPDLDVTITFADGQMALGSIQLGPAPRIILR